jgi:hypothetical protein
MFRARVALLVSCVIFVAATKANAVTGFIASLTTAQATQLNVSTGIDSVSFLVSDATIATDSGYLVSPHTQWRVGRAVGDLSANPFNKNSLSDTVVTPVATLSEPTTVSLLGVGLLVIGYVCRRRFRNTKKLPPS